VRYRETMNIIRTLAAASCLLAAVGLAVWVLVERQGCTTLAEENEAARQQLSQMDKLLAENQRLAKLIGETWLSRMNQNAESPLSADERALVRLRAEVEALRDQSNEIAILRTDTRQVRAASETALATRKAAGQTANHINISANSAGPNGQQFELLSAQYWTGNTNLDVAAELRERIRGDGLKAVANNNLKGDPDFGEVKHLTVVYRYGDALFTNEFREGEFVVLPKPADQ